MKNIYENTLNGFIADLSSGEPAPGGGGASALLGAVGAALCSMAAKLTSGKKKYEMYQSDIESIISITEESIRSLLNLIEKDAKAFEPLAAAYKISKEDPDRDEILEKALAGACFVPMEILKEISGLAGIVEQLAKKGSKLAVSDAGVAAASCRAAAEGAVMNIYINTKMMKNRGYAEKLNGEAEKILNETVSRCVLVYTQITDEIRGI